MTSMTGKLFKNPEASRSFLAHIRKAQFLVRLLVLVAYLLKWLFRGYLRFIPVVRAVDGPISGLLAMHNEDRAAVPLKYTAPSCVLGESENQYFDLLVIGSGPGGAITADMAARAGQTVLCIEKGGPIVPSIPHHTPTQMREHFDRGGQELIFGKKPIVFAQGSAWGGGSEINSGLYHRLPHHISERWSEIIPSFTGTNRREAEQLVEDRLKIRTQSTSELGEYTDSPLPEMQSFLNWDGGVIPRWRTYGKDSFKHHGMSSTYLKSAFEAGLVAAPGHTVTQISPTGGGVTARLEGERCLHAVRGAQLCISAGSVGTPKLLLQAGLANRSELDFQFHAMLREVGVFPRVVNDLEDIDPYQIWEPNFRFKIGAAVGTRPLLASTLASRGINAPQDFKTHGIYYVSIPSMGEGGFIGARSNVYPSFSANAKMLVEAQTGVLLLRNAIQAAGGNPRGKPELSMSTVHVFGSVPLGSSPVIDPEGFVRGSNKKIFVRDGSLLPSPPLVNPQGPIMHLVSHLELLRHGSI